MRNSRGGALSTLIVLLSVALSFVSPSLLRADEPAPKTRTATRVDFGRQIRPILSDNCFHCHGPDSHTRKAKLRLDVKEGVFATTRDGKKVVAPGKADESELYARLITHESSELMPPEKSGKKLTPVQIRLLKDWINQGAPMTDHWAFLPPRRPEIPVTKRTDWVKSPIDAFVLRRLENEGLSPTAEADRATLIRRVTLDLIGLPPTPREVADFLADRSTNAYEKIVDRLLSSNHYGERMAMQWLDYARFADSHGFQTDSSRQMWPWRDWVIDAYNRNMPFDRFTIEQLAGDLLPKATRSQIVATGFHRNHRINGEGGSIDEEWRIENIVDRVDTTGITWLGLSFGCARCHDHRFDPITMKDYYQLFAFFNNVPETGMLKQNRGGGNSEPTIELPSPEHEAEIARLDAEIKTTEASLSDAKQANDMNLVAAEETKINALKKERQQVLNSIPNVMVMREGPPRDAFILLRGQYDKRGGKVSAALPEIFGSLPPGAPANRLGLAQWIASPSNPLTARVWVNRAWEHFFGVGIVKTSENLGSQAEPPSDSELLDWLATEFVRLGWDMKAMQKAIVMSATYRQSSHVTPELLERDPENRLLARGSRFRLSGEIVRDQVLSVAGLLSPKIGGPSARPYMPDGVWDETSVYGDLLKYKSDSGEGLYRRTMYTIWKRTAAPPTMLIFDAPNRELCVVRRSRTNTPLQALALLNEVTYVEAARKLGERMMIEGGDTPASRLTYGFRLATGRMPRPNELQVLERGWSADHGKFRGRPDAAAKLIGFGSAPTASGLDRAELAAYTLSANVILNLDEFVTRE